MIQSKHLARPVESGLDMDLELARRACEAQLPALAARRLRAHGPDIAALQALALHSESAQRLARKLFSLMANASVHCGGANTLRPVLEQCALVRSYLWLRDRVQVSAPEPLVRGTPDLVVTVEGTSIWVDTRVRSAQVMAERGRLAVLLVDRTLTMRREPPLRMGEDYAGEFHLLDTRAPGTPSSGAFALEQQTRHGPVPAPVQALARATGAGGDHLTARGTNLEYSA